jgi:hypothetical protein
MSIFKAVKSTLHRGGSIVRIPVVATVFALAVCCALPALVSGFGVAYAQNTNATIRGQVLDPSGALVPSAQVSVVNQDTGVRVFSGKTDSAGAFVASQVIPGTYRITVTAPGLKQSVLENVIATVASVASVNVTMQIGEVTETVTISSKGEELDRSSSDISTLIAPSEVQSLPLQGRATENLLAFIPGVAHGGAADTPSTSQLSINGSRTLNTEVMLNGVSTIVASTGTPATLPSPDGVDSFRVLTTNAPAEYGRTSGAVISVNTISGTNTYHGNLYFLLRNEDMDANTFFHKLTISSTTGLPTARGRDRNLQEGGSFGGAVRIPHLYSGRDKTFFFVNYDRTIIPNTTTLTATVPTLAQRGGDLSNASNNILLDGNTRAADCTVNGVVTCPAQTIYQPNGTKSAAFTNQAAIGPIDPAAAKILALLPLPNTVGTFDKVNNRYTGNWTSQQNLTGHVQKIVVRVDEVVTPSDRFSFNVYRFTTSTPNAVTWNSALLNTNWACTCNNAWLPSVDYTRTWNPTLVMDLNFGFFRNVVIRVPPGTGMNASSLTGIATLPLDQMPEITGNPGLPNPSGALTGYVGADTNTSQINITNTFTPFGTVTKTFGPHNFRFGASLRKNQFNSYNPAGSPEGAYTIDGSITNLGSAGNANTGIADFLLGKIKSANYEQAMPETGRRNWNLGIFFQDDWRITPKLTVNAGLRWEYESPLKIATNVYSRFDPSGVIPAGAVTPPLLVAGQNASASLNVKTPKADFSPRIGFSYSVDNKTVIRAAFGTFYGTIFQNLGGQLAYPGYDNTINTVNPGTAIAQSFSLSQGLPLSPAVGTNPSLAPLLVGAGDGGPGVGAPYSITGVSFNDFQHMSLVQQWNFGFERTLPFGITLEANYVGNHALHLPTNVPANIVPLSAVPNVTLLNTTQAAQDARPFKTLSSWTAVDNVGSSDYNALQVSVRRQFSTRLAVISNYTYAKSLDDGSTIYNFSAPNGTANPQYTADGPHRELDWAPSNIDATHTLNIGMEYTTPGQWWMRDWHISPVFIAHTGLPVNITQTNEITNVGQQRPNGNSQLLKHGPAFTNGAVLQYWDYPASDPNFPLTPSGPVYATLPVGGRTQIVATGLGNVPRDSMRQPGEVDFDASVSKDFRIWEALKFQIRVDAFNVINHTNFTAPSGALTVQTVLPPSPTVATAANTVANFGGSTGFGRITGTQPNRQMQASARFTF